MPIFIQRSIIAFNVKGIPGNWPYACNTAHRVVTAIRILAEKQRAFLFEHRTGWVVFLGMYARSTSVLTYFDFE